MKKVVFLQMKSLVITSQGRRSKLFSAVTDYMTGFLFGLYYRDVRISTTVVP